MEMEIDAENAFISDDRRRTADIEA